MKISTWLRVIPVIFAVITVAVLLSLSGAVSHERSYYQQDADMVSLGNELREAADYLSEQARYYIISSDEKHLDAYMRETGITMTREKILRKLVEMNAPQNEIDLLNKAKELSYSLEALDKNAFEMARAGDMESARRILFSDEYKSKEQEIFDAVDLFQTRVNLRCGEAADEAKNQAELWIRLIGAASILIVVGVFISFITLNGKIGEMTEMAGIARRISDGDFNLDFSKYESKDEFGMLASSFRNIIDTISNIDAEINSFIKDTSIGNLVYHIDNNNFKGQWSQILAGLNNAVQTTRNQIIENAPIAFIVVSGDTIIDCNRYAIEHIGMSTGKNIEDFYYDVSQRHEILARLNKEGIVDRELIAFRIHGGEPRRFSTFMNVISYSGKRTIILWCMDVEEERLKNDMILRSRQDLQKLINALPMAMIIENPQTNEIGYANEAFYKLMNIPVDIQGRIPDEDSLFAPEQSDGVQALNKKTDMTGEVVGARGTVSAEFTYRSMSGRIIEARVTAGEIMYDGNQSVVKMIQDIGDEKLKNQMLKNAAEREREANQLKSRFLANMSHEIRTPMNAIIGFAQIALMREQDSQNIDTYRKINSSCKNLLTIINDILDFSKIEAQKMDVTEDVFVLEDIVSNAFMVASGRIEEKHIEMLLDIQTNLPVKLVGDKTRLWQILKNLLDNSAKYTESGRVVLELSLDREEKGKIFIAFKVSDTGIGMSQQQIGELFQPFKQFGTGTDYKNYGTGLGMAIIKELLELLGGTINIQSEVGVGTTITVTIGFKPYVDETTLAGLISQDTPEGCSILVADDDHTSCKIMQRLLETAGFSVTCVYNGKQALEEVKKREEEGNPFKVVILDYILGDDNGIEIGRKITQNGSQSKLLIVSAYVKRIPENLLHEVGFKDVLQKPLVPSDFIRRLYDTLDDGSANIAEKRKGFNGTRVLVCEDNQLNREIAVEMLKLMGVDPDVAADGKQCLEMLEKKEYDIVLMDILMPVMDGREAVRLIRASDKPYKNICVLAMTANVMLEQIDEFMNIGMNGHIPKPVEFDVLYDSIEKNMPDNKQKGYIKAIPDFVNTEFAIEGIAVGEGIARFAGDEARYKKALLRFAGGDYNCSATDEGFSRYIHTIKGASGNLGMKRLSELAQNVERAIRGGLPPDETYSEFVKELQAIIGRIKSKVVIQEQNAVPMRTGTSGEYVECVKALREAVRLSNPSKCEKLLATLSTTRWLDIEAPDFTALRQAVDQYDFILAEDLLNGISHP